MAQLDLIARFENCSISYMANQAIPTFVEEGEIVATGLTLVEQDAPSLATSSVHDWLNADGDQSSSRPD